MAIFDNNGAKKAPLGVTLIRKGLIKESDIEIFLDEADYQSEQILIRLTHEELMEKIRNKRATGNVK